MGWPVCILPALHLETMPPDGVRQPAANQRQTSGKPAAMDKNSVVVDKCSLGAPRPSSRTPTPPPLPSPLYSKPPHPPHQISDVKIGSLLPMAQLSPFMAFTTPHALLLILVRAICLRYAVSDGAAKYIPGFCCAVPLSLG